MKPLVPDRRRVHASRLAAEILHIVGKHISDEDHRRDAMRDLHYELFDKLHAEGIEIITDQDRAQIGLPPRGPEGWTAEELWALERGRIEMMLRPVVVPR